MLLIFHIFQQICQTNIKFQLDVLWSQFTNLIDSIPLSLLQKIDTRLDHLIINSVIIQSGWCRWSVLPLTKLLHLLYHLINFSCQSLIFILRHRIHHDNRLIVISDMIAYFPSLLPGLRWHVQTSHGYFINLIFNFLDDLFHSILKSVRLVSVHWGAWGWISHDGFVQWG